MFVKMHLVVNYMAMLSPDAYMYTFKLLHVACLVFSISLVMNQY